MKLVVLGHAATSVSHRRGPLGERTHCSLQTSSRLCSFDSLPEGAVLTPSPSHPLQCNCADTSVLILAEVTAPSHFSASKTSSFQHGLMLMPHCLLMNQKPYYSNPDFNPSFSLHLLRTVCKLAALQGLASVHLCHQPDHTIPATPYMCDMLARCHPQRDPRLWQYTGYCLNLPSESYSL